MLNLVLLTSAEIHSLCTIRTHRFLLGIFKVGRKKLSIYINLKGHGDGGDGIGEEVFASIFHCKCHNPITTLSQLFLDNFYYVTFQFMKNVLSLNVTLIFLKYIWEIICTNIVSNKEVMKEQYQYQFGSYWGSKV